MPDPAGSPPADYAKELDALIAERNQQQQDADAKRSTLSTTQAEIQAITVSLSTLDKRIAELTAIKNDLGSRQDAAQAERDKAAQTRDWLKSELEKELSAAHRDEIDQIVNAAAKALHDSKANLDARTSELATAESALATATAGKAAADLALQRAQAAFKGLPGEIQKAVAGVTAASTAASAKYQNGQFTEAWWLTGALDLAIQQLDALPATEGNTRFAAVADARTAADSAAQALADATAKRDAASAALDLAQKDDQKAIAGRDAAIKAKLSDLLVPHP